MKVDLILDHQSILENRQSTIFFAIRIRAEAAPTPSEPTAYALIIDHNNPSELILRLAENIIRHLPANSQITVISAADAAEPIYALGDLSDKQSLIALIHQLDPAFPENLSVTWTLACRELKSSATPHRKILYLTHDPSLKSLLSLPTPATLQENITTSVFAARPGANANLLQHLARAGHGNFHKNFSPDELNSITTAELGFLIPPSAQKIRLRLKPLDFCDAIHPLGAHSQEESIFPNRTVEFSLPDLLAGEDRTVCFNLEVQPLPCIEGQPITSLENEPLLEIELRCDEISSHSITPRTFHRTVHICSQAEADNEKQRPENFERRPTEAPSPFGRGLG